VLCVYHENYNGALHCQHTLLAVSDHAPKYSTMMHTETASVVRWQCRANSKC
jgi:hypothetical protein